jgi:hypothetical protein
MGSKVYTIGQNLDSSFCHIPSCHVATQCALTPQMHSNETEANKCSARRNASDRPHCHADADADRKCNYQHNYDGEGEPLGRVGGGAAR